MNLFRKHWSYKHFLSQLKKNAKKGVIKEFFMDCCVIHGIPEKDIVIFRTMKDGNSYVAGYRVEASMIMNSIFLREGNI